MKPSLLMNGLKPDTPAITGTSLAFVSSSSSSQGALTLFIGQLYCSTVHHCRPDSCHPRMARPQTLCGRVVPFMVELSISIMW